MSDGGKNLETIVHAPTMFLVKQHHLVDMQCLCSADAAVLVVGGVHRL